MRYTNLLQPNLPFIAGSVIMLFPAAFWLAVILSFLFNHNSLMDLFVILDKEYWAYSMVILVILPAAAFLYNTLHIMKLELRCDEERIWLSAGFKPLLLNAGIVLFAFLNILLVAGYYVSENIAFVHHPFYMH